MSRFSKRVITPEIIDDFSLSGKELYQNLKEIEWVNKYLGGTSISAYPILHYVTQNQRKPIHIVDVGCGSGDLLKALHTYCHHLKTVKFTGIDANEHILQMAKEMHFPNAEVNLLNMDVLTESEFPDGKVYILNLFLHHFEKEQIHHILDKICQKSPEIIVINDLHRSSIAYFLFHLVCKLMGFSKMTINDGLLSIIKGFRKKELKGIADMLKPYRYTLKWKWAFRWQLILKKINNN